MKYQSVLSAFINGWNFTRSETLEILNSLDDERLLFKPKGEKWQLASLSEHERLHHGQFISYFTLAGFELPKAFKSNWAL